MTIANIFVDSQDDIGSFSYLCIKLLLLLLLLGGLVLLLGYQIAPLFHLSAALHTHAQMRIKAKVYFGRPRPHTVLITSFSSSRGLAESRAPRPSAGNFLRPRKSSWWYCAVCMCWARPSALFCGWVYFECCADAAVRETERNAESEEAFRAFLLIGNVLKTDSKTKPTSKLNCRVIIIIYKLGYQECKKRHLLDIFLNSFELWMKWTWRNCTGSISFSLQHINKTHGCLFFIIVIIKICS